MWLRSLAMVSARPRAWSIPAVLAEADRTPSTFSTRPGRAAAAAGAPPAPAGAPVAKHGNRASSSRSGSADVLECLGVRIDVPLTLMGRAIREIGIGFLFARAAHTAPLHAAPARKQIGARTVFNLLGPLTNPAGARSQVVGVFSADAVDLVAEALAGVGGDRAL